MYAKFAEEQFNIRGLLLELTRSPAFLYRRRVNSVLDSTMIVWASECAQSDVGDPHDLRKVGFTLIGGGQGHFQIGRYLRFAGGDAYSHNRLLLSLLHYMGLDAETFGEPDYCAGGPLPLLTS